jgi:hypothetical protein
MTDRRRKELSEIARAGRDKIQERASKQQAREAKDQRRQAAIRHRRYRRRLLASMLPLAPLSGVHYILIIIMIPFAMVPLFTALQLAAVYLTCGIALLLPMTWIYARWKLTREQAWVGTLPFPLKRYPDILGGKAYKNVEIDLVFAGKAVSPELLSELVAAAPLPTTLLGMQGSQAEIRVTFRKGSKFDGQRAWLRVWTRHFIHRVLIPLHEEYPIDYVRFPEPYKGP